MYNEIIFAGFGGQGVLLAGKLLCLAAMAEGKNVSHIPSYGAEMRGGTANCSVIISDEEVASPVVEYPGICIVLNTPSLIKFEGRIKKGGLLIYNSSLVTVKPQRQDITIEQIAANDISEKYGSDRGVNMAALGALLKLRPELASIESLEKALNIGVSERNRKFNETNIAIIREAYSLF